MALTIEGPGSSLELLRDLALEIAQDRAVRRDLEKTLERDLTATSTALGRSRDTLDRAETRLQTAVDELSRVHRLPYGERKAALISADANLRTANSHLAAARGQFQECLEVVATVALTARLTNLDLSRLVADASAQEVMNAIDDPRSIGEKAKETAEHAAKRVSAAARKRAVAPSQLPAITPRPNQR